MFTPIPEILNELRAGRMIVLTDDERRENEGDLVLPAQFASPEAITFMLKEAKGYLCLSLPEADCDRLDLVPQAAVNTSKRGTAFTVSIDGHPKHGFTTGVSAKERAKCVQMMIDPKFTTDDFVRPGHINPLRSRDGGVLVRTGQTEGSVDLCRLAGLTPAALIIEIMKDDGEMARVPDLIPFCKQHNIKMCSVAQIIEHRLARESLVRRVEPQARSLRTTFGTFDAFLFQSVVDPLPHLVLTVGGVGQLDPSGVLVPDVRPTLIRMHRRNLLGDVFGDLDSGTGGSSGGEGPSSATLHASMQAIRREGRGAIVYLRTSSTGSKPGHDLEARLQTIQKPGLDVNDPDLHGEAGENAVPMPLREFGVGGQILRNLGLSKLRLLTNSSKAMPGLDAFGLEVVERVPIR